MKFESKTSPSDGEALSACVIVTQQEEEVDGLEEMHQFIAIKSFIFALPSLK